MEMILDAFVDKWRDRFNEQSEKPNGFDDRLLFIEMFGEASESLQNLDLVDWDGVLWPRV